MEKDSNVDAWFVQQDLDSHVLLNETINTMESARRYMLCVSLMRYLLGSMLL